MGKVFYSLSGEGRGHATRVKAVVDELRLAHSVRIYAPGVAYDFLARVYNNSDVEVKRIPGLSFNYTADYRLNYLNTGWGAIGFFGQAPRILDRLQRDIEKEKPDLAITDFEPLLPRAANRAGLPFISLNHQHFLVTSDFSSLPLQLRRYAAFMATFVRSYYTGQLKTIVSSFYFPDLKSGLEDVEQIGVLLRPEIIEANPEVKPHIVVYLRRFVAPNLLNALQRCGMPVKIYGLGKKQSQGNLSFLEIDATRFVEDLATSSALISTAGNQLVGEALYLGKPVLVIPESGNQEQEINGYFLQQSGAGLNVDMDKVGLRHVREILDFPERFTANIDKTRLYGNPIALDIINQHLTTFTEASVPADAFL